MGERLLGCVAITDSRTMQQDVDFAIRQLVDIGLRALTSINDPTTAVDVILRLGTLLRRLTLKEPVAAAIRDGRGRLLVRPWDLNHDEYVAHAFDQLRQQAPSEPAVAVALARVLNMLILHGEVTDHRLMVPALRRQLSLLSAAVQDAGWLAADVERFEAVADDQDPADHTIDPAGGEG